MVLGKRDRRVARSLGRKFPQPADLFGGQAGTLNFERCRIGLPEWFSSNIDTYCLSASGQAVAFGTDTGSMFASWDEGESWQEVTTGLAPVRCVLVR